MDETKTNRTEILKTGDGHAHLVHEGKCTLCGKTREALEAERRRAVLGAPERAPLFELGATPEGAPIAWPKGGGEPVSPSEAGLETVNDAPGSWVGGGDPVVDMARAMDVIRAMPNPPVRPLVAGLGPDGKLTVIDPTRAGEVEITAYGHKLTGASPVHEPPPLPVVLAGVPTLNVWHELDAEKSSNVEGWAFDHLRGILVVKFRKATKAGAQVYAYPNTTGNEARDLMLTERPSKWVLTWTKGRPFRVLSPFATCPKCKRPIGEAEADYHGETEEMGEARCHLGPSDDRNVLEAMSAAAAAALGVL